MKLTKEQIADAGYTHNADDPYLQGVLRTEFPDNFELVKVGSTIPANTPFGWYNDISCKGATVSWFQNFKFFSDQSTNYVLIISPTTVCIFLPAQNKQTPKTPAAISEGDKLLKFFFGCKPSDPAKLPPPPKVINSWPETELDW